MLPPPPPPLLHRHHSGYQNFLKMVMLVVLAQWRCMRNAYTKRLTAVAAVSRTAARAL